MCVCFLIFVASLHLLLISCCLLNWVSRVSAAAATHVYQFIHFSTYHFLHLTSDFEDSTPPQSMWLRSGPFQLIWLSSTPRWHTCGQSSHQKPKQLSGRSSYSYSSRDSCRLFGVEMAWPVFSHKLPWSAWAEAPEAKRISDMLLRRGQQWDKGLWKTHI